MVKDHWWNNVMVSMDRSGLVTVLSLLSDYLTAGMKVGEFGSTYLEWNLVF